MVPEPFEGGSGQQGPADIYVDIEQMGYTE